MLFDDANSGRGAEDLASEINAEAQERTKIHFPAEHAEVAEGHTRLRVMREICIGE